MQSTNPPTDSSRREFLHTSAVLGAGALLSGCAATGSQAKRDPTRMVSTAEKLRIGIIGTGGMGTAHARRFAEFGANGDADVQVAALSDVCQPRLAAAQQGCEEISGHRAETYTDYLELLARDDLHGVLIAAPEHWHGTMARDAIAHGLHVYCEKPMTLRLDDGLSLYRTAVAAKDLKFQVGTQFVTHEKYAVARRLIDAGEIGEVTSSQTSYCRNSEAGEWTYYEIDPQWEPGTNLDWDAWCGPLGTRAWDPAVYARWRRYRDYSTGIIGDLLVHVMTPLIGALDLGWPTRVSALGGHMRDKAMENHDQVQLMVQFSDGHVMTVMGSTCNERGLETMIRGHRASLFLGGKDCLLRPERLYAEEIDEQNFECAPEGGDQDRLRLDWLNAIRTGDDVKSPVELGTKIMVAVDLAARALWDGGTWNFDPETMTTDMA